ncbi:MAG: gluconate 2-dehydrogenase subunit 3 family protein [Bryobacterales bacterium]|nr:gluconate 2-dehydrogenase subunit 3 family protein [Bryobacteraceae bacterium]MDW8353376.1 gluconate 2-dehydrogenase subunit 3 family protein [Bryobacterales bacterium]
MSENVSRRQLLYEAAAATLSGTLGVQAAQHVHRAVTQQRRAARGPYKPRYFNPHEWRTLARLTDLIIPADEHSPGALAAGAPEFIDLLCRHNVELAAMYTGGLAWLDREMERRYGKNFVDAAPEQQTALLDLIAYRKNDSPELAPGIRFFDWLRKMTVDAYYTSKVGIADLGYQGNVGMTEFNVPEEAIQYALRRSPFGGE